MRVVFEGIEDKRVDGNLEEKVSGNDKSAANTTVEDEESAEKVNSGNSESAEEISSGTEESVESIADSNDDSIKKETDGNDESIEKIAVLISDETEKRTYHMPLSDLPEDCKLGDVLEVSFDEKSKVSAIKILRQETSERLNQNRKKREQLLRRKNRK